MLEQKIIGWALIYCCQIDSISSFSEAHIGVGERQAPRGPLGGASRFRRKRPWNGRLNHSIEPRRGEL
ncbi:hypothetical protein KaCgl_10680 [Corynebacterium glutamicum]|nr:hypothetical protein KaCgl_10680 [Corynebacterium glutamicum]